MINDSRLSNETREWLISIPQEASTSMHGNLRLEQLRSLAAEASLTFLFKNPIPVYNTPSLASKRHM